MQIAYDRTIASSEHGAIAPGAKVKPRGHKSRAFGANSPMKAEAQVSARRCGDRGSDASVPITTAHCASSDGFV